MTTDRRRQDIDPQETREWLDSLEAVVRHDGPERAAFLLEALHRGAWRRNLEVELPLVTPYANTIPASAQPAYPGDVELEEEILDAIRWNAMAMVVRANRIDSALGGHLSTYASAAVLFEVGYNHFFRGPESEDGGDLVFIQGHSSPGIYGRAFLEGRLEEERLAHFRREALTPGLSSYPHPWLMPDFWQFPTVSMGLSPMLAIYQARFMRYLRDRGLAETSDRHVWAFLGDGEMDEPEAMGALTVASRERLDNLIFVVNCNLQRLDGPVRGNSSIVRELEGAFRGAGWNVIKVLWNSAWDELLEGDLGDAVLRRMEATVDGDWQRWAADQSRETFREEFFSGDDLEELGRELSGDELQRLGRGGHDPHKVHAAYAAAVDNEGSPTVILAKTVKGYGLGPQAHASNRAHQQKKLDEEGALAYRERLGIPLEDDEVEELPFWRPDEDSEAMQYLHERRHELGGYTPKRPHGEHERLEIPDLDAFESQIRGSGDREISTTMSFVRVLSTLTRDESLGERVVPIVADEARTFGMEGLFRQIGIYAPEGQQYTPVDKDELAYYREEQDGQMLQEGINEAGAMCSWIAAATSYSAHGIAMVPFYIYYSMFGFQRVGDFAWAAADMHARGFLIGATSGRTTLAGEGLQHQDGHSQLVAATIPNCHAYDPAYGYEVAVIVRDGLRRMLEQDEDVYYYLTVGNDNYAHPAMPEGVEEDIVRGMYLLSEGDDDAGHRVQLLGSGAILEEVVAAGRMLREDWDVAADVWSVTSFNELRRDGLSVRRWNRLHPGEQERVPFVTEQLQGRSGPVIASTDYMQAYAEQIDDWVPAPYTVLGCDGFGRSDTRQALRRFFEVDAAHVVVATLSTLARQGELDAERVTEAMERYDIDPERRDPVTV
ncbi:MAG: pyruvate dehydrogenase (acetyl-transferring), homodimeric type [Acidobacteriota bacterium]